MANKIEYTNLRPTDGFVNYGSRYANSSKIIYYGNNRVLSFTTYKKSRYPESSADKFTVIPPGMEYRPDKVSLETYGTVDYWWKILEANGMNDIYAFKSGTNIRLPATIF